MKRSPHLDKLIVLLPVALLLGLYAALHLFFLTENETARREWAETPVDTTNAPRPAAARSRAGVWADTLRLNPVR